jgi:hypothetical protein
MTTRINLKEHSRRQVTFYNEVKKYGWVIELEN